MHSHLLNDMLFVQISCSMRARYNMVRGLWTAAQNNASQIAALLIETQSDIIKVCRGFTQSYFREFGIHDVSTYLFDAYALHK